MLLPNPAEKASLLTALSLYVTTIWWLTGILAGALYHSGNHYLFHSAHAGGKEYEFRYREGKQNKHEL